MYFLLFCGALVTTLLLTGRLIPALRRRARQPIYEEGPSWHKSKSGTPTMGGLSFFVACTVFLLCFCLVLFFDNRKSEAVSLLLAIGYGTTGFAIGLSDDLTKLRRHENAGLSPKQKLVLQSLSAALFLFLRRTLLGDGGFRFSFGTLNPGIYGDLLSFFLLLFFVNAVNLTDGIDGLCASVTFAVGISLGYLSFGSVPSVGAVAAVLIGSTTGFLAFNLHPAKIFMGDTGSLFFGSMIGAAFVSLGNPLLMVPVGGVFLLEGVSVLLQIFWFRLTKKRLFLMAPLHHHFEKKGLSENTICILALLSTFLFSLPAFFLYL